MKFEILGLVEDFHANVLKGFFVPCMVQLSWAYESANFTWLLNSRKPDVDAESSLFAGKKLIL